MTLLWSVLVPKSKLLQVDQDIRSATKVTHGPRYFRWVIALSYKGILYCLFCIWLNVFKVSCCSLYQNFIPFQCWIIFHCMAIPHFVYPFIFFGHLDHFCLLAFVSNSAMNIRRQVFELCFHFFEYIPRSGVAGSYNALSLASFKKGLGLN